MDSFGIIGLLPFIIALFFLIWQNDVIFPIIGGLIIGSILLSKLNPVLGFIYTAGETVLVALLDSSNILKIVLVGECLIFYSLLDRSGYINIFINKLMNKKLTKNILEITIFSSGILLFIDRHFGALLTGIFTKPFTGKRKLTPLKHAYLINTASSSVSTLIPFTTLTPLTLATIGTTFKVLGIEFSPIRALYLSLPYQFFNIFSLFTAVTLIVLKTDILLMKKNEHTDTGRALSFGLQLNTQVKPEARTAFYGVISALTVVFGTVTAGFVLGRNGTISYPIGNALIFKTYFVNALFVGIIFILLYSIVTKTVKYTQWKMNNGAVLTTLAQTLFYIVLSMAVVVLAQKLSVHSSVMKFLSGGPLAVTILPMLFFLFSSGISLLSGSAPFTILAVIPLALRIISSNMTDPLLIDEMIFAAIAAVLSGSVFGDLNSPFSLTFIISSASSSASVAGHFTTQIFYSLIAFFTTIVFGYLFLMLNMKPYLSISSGFLVIAVFIMLISRRNI